MSTNQENWPQSRGERWRNFLRQNQSEIVTVLALVFVGLTCFALGRLTASDFNSTLKFTPAALTSLVGEKTKKTVSENEPIRFVASKSGAKYHWPWCSFAERIKEENKIYFDTEQQAQADGYSRCGNFLSQAPMGFKEATQNAQK
ncbi:MAG: hypothetical protein COU85_01930 [Candidatus Portnoybacteria bacterium CG10_big_fil_rev_8_21_14_0_10_44_7]|uniref:Ada DNA repair metal-binding domain-containing protein n=1 Tax=Candidatus Portnoybacteria bacterium CG10_big_fil_rev_8_21_14_0_10_44_7 TaxID=1974816 RepID=A0A2M8KIK3_9BACT|nr:MAG: hypothetical protein COU85_01930 [Candidatus Portnoybacteria bacterium CG10_big_fil_rev_8_21_14_0_10_44_7]